MAESKKRSAGTTKKSTGTGRSGGTRSSAPKKPTKEELAMEAERLRERKKLHDEVFAVIYIAVGLFLVLSLLTDTTGALGAAIKSFMFGLFGMVAYILAVFFIVYGILIFAKKTSFMTARSVIFVVLMFLLVTSLNSVSYVSNPDFKINAGAIKEVYGLGLKGPGVVGALVGRLIFSLLGKTGLYIFSIAGILISLLFIIQTPVSDLFDNMRVKRQAARALREEEEEKIREYEEQMSIEDIKPVPQKPASKPAAKPQVTDLEDVETPINIKKPEAKAEPKLNLDSIKSMHEELPQGASKPELAAPEEPAPEPLDQLDPSLAAAYLRQLRSREEDILCFERRCGGEGVSSVALCDVTGDGVPELLYATSQEGAGGAFLWIYRYENGEAVKCGQFTWEAEAGQERLACLFQTEGEPNLYAEYTDPSGGAWADRVLRFDPDGAGGLRQTPLAREQSFASGAYPEYFFDGMAYSETEYRALMTSFYSRVSRVLIFDLQSVLEDRVDSRLAAFPGHGLSYWEAEAFLGG